LSSESTLLFGKSGIGKSSILNAGVIPAARRNGYVPVLVRLSHNEVENDYAVQIKMAIARCLTTNETCNVSRCIKEIYPQKFETHETLYEYFHRHEFYKQDGDQLTRVKLLIIFDQFEEIFTLQSNESFKQIFFSEFADVINDNIPKSLQSHHSQNLNQKQKNKIDITTQNGFEKLFDSLKSVDDCSLDFVTDNEIHFVFTIREDLLSEFEHYTAFIPSLKRDRYGLRPINEQQAADIILKPQPGLVDKSVAIEIIEKLTKHSDVKLDGVPQIEVDVAILSLYLCRLFEAKNSNIITSTLLKERGELIISDFYIEAISNLSESDVEYLEKNLLDANGHRNNIPVVTLKNQSSITDDQLDDLCNKTKILRQFYYAGAMRVEFIHDILCDVVIQHKVEREQQRQLQLAEEMQVKLKTRSKIITYGIIAISAILLFALFKFMSNENENREVTNVKHNIIISLVEDSTITATDYWKGKIDIIGLYPNGKSVTLMNKNIDKGVRDSIYTFDIDSINSIRFSLEFGDFREIGNYKDIDFTRTKKELVENPSVKLTIGRNLPKMTPYYGNVCLNIEGLKIPITDAAILMQDRFVRTDSVGNFNLSIEDNLMENQDLSLIIAKEGLACNQYKIHFDDEQIHKYIVEVADSTAFDGFLTRIGEINASRNYSTCGYDSIPGKGIRVHFSDKTKSDRMCLRAVKEKIINNRFCLSGYYYFEKDYAKKGVYAYHAFTGFIDVNATTSSNSSRYKKFELVSYDVAMNKQTITGRYNLTTAVWSGEIRTSWGVYATF
jgi:hypothetical protein